MPASVPPRNSRVNKRMKKAMLPLVGGFAALVSTGLASSAQATGQAQDRGVTAARAISDRYHDESAAIADGFTATDHCVEAPGLGGMGHHYVNFARLDTRLEPGRPEVVLYKDGTRGRVLTGIEYIVVDRDQDLHTDDDRPVLWGHAFDGPMPGHEPGMPVHYDLHVWAWHDNPNGAFSTWNPTISC